MRLVGAKCGLMNIVILDDYQDAVRKLACASKLDALSAKVYTNTVKGVGQLAVRLKDAEIVVLIGARTHITRSLLSKLPKLRCIVQAGCMGSHIDLQACTAHGVAVAANSHAAHAVAEFTWALLMAASRRLPQYIANLRHGVWQQSGLRAISMPSNFGLGTALRGKTLGVWGFGNVGQLVAGLGRASGMRVLVWGSEQARAAACAQGYVAAGERTQLFAQSDFLTLHLRLSERTRGIIGLSDLMQMKPTATLVNTAHAELFQPDSLAAALGRGHPGMAAVDVYESEPIMQGQPLLRLENCLCTPHISDVELENYEQYFNAAFDNILDFIVGKPSNVLNPDALQLKRK